jgi:hypothetical protein
MHISTTKIAFSLEEAFNHLQVKDPQVFAQVERVISEYAQQLYKEYPGTRLAISPVKYGMKLKSIGVPIFFESNEYANSRTTMQD